MFVMILQPFLLCRMSFGVRFLWAGALLCVSVCIPAAAQAAFLFCNQTGLVIEAAFGRRDNGVWISEGWWQIQPGQCARVYNKPLAQRFYFYHARALGAGKDDASPLVWTGKYSFCTDNKAFKIEGDGNCEARHYQTRGFQDVDVGPRQKDYTLTFRGKDGF